MVLAYSLGPRDHVLDVDFCPRGCFVLVLWVRALLDRGLAPRRFWPPALFGLHVFCECFLSPNALAV